MKVTNGKTGSGDSVSERQKWWGWAGINNNRAFVLLRNQSQIDWLLLIAPLDRFIFGDVETRCSVLTASSFLSSQHSILFEQASIELYNNNNNNNDKLFYHSNKHMHVAMQALWVLLGGAIYICYTRSFTTTDHHVIMFLQTA